MTAHRILIKTWFKTPRTPIYLFVHLRLSPDFSVRSCTTLLEGEGRGAAVREIKSRLQLVQRSDSLSSDCVRGCTPQLPRGILFARFPAFLSPSHVKRQPREIRLKNFNSAPPWNPGRAHQISRRRELVSP